MTTEASERTALVAAEPLTGVTVFGTDEPMGVFARTQAIASALGQAVKQLHLSTVINRREYVLAEGWSYMGSMLGVFPRTTRVETVRDKEGSAIGFEAYVELVCRDGSVVGGAVAECSWAENNWADRDAFALKSMAQTRATGKAYRMAFGFVMKAAGFEATPAEEMVDTPARRDPRTSSPRGEQEGGLRNVGELLTWAMRKHRATRRDVLALLSVESPDEIRAEHIADAQERIDAHYAEQAD